MEQYVNFYINCISNDRILELEMTIQLHNLQDNTSKQNETSQICSV